MSELDTSNIPPDHVETLRLRIELYRWEDEWKEKNITVSQAAALKPLLVSKKLKEKMLAIDILESHCAVHQK